MARQYIRVYASERISVHAAVAIVPRTWRERLFSWPWRPWLKVKAFQIN